MLIELLIFGLLFKSEVGLHSTYFFMSATKCKIVYTISMKVLILYSGREGNSMKFNENDVLSAIQKNDAAFERIYSDTYMDLFKLAFYITGNREFAKDAVSDTFLDAYTGIPKLRDSSKFESWIIKILITKCNHILREKYEIFSVFNPKVKTLDDCAPKGLDSADSIAEKTDIQKALCKLNKQDRIIISLCIIQGYKSHEAAAILSMNPATVRSRLNRSLTKLKSYLEVE